GGAFAAESSEATSPPFQARAIFSLSSAAGPGNPSSGSSSRARPDGLGARCQRSSERLWSVPTTTVGADFPEDSSLHHRDSAPASVAGSSSPGESGSGPAQGGSARSR